MRSAGKPQLNLVFSASALLLVNLIPLSGMLFLNWNPFSIIIAYWFENIVVGGYTVLKILTAKGEAVGTVKGTLNGRDINSFGAAGLAGFFAVHYGMFTFVHGIFVMVIFGTQLGSDFFSSFIGMLLFGMGLVVSHGISYLVNFIGAGERYQNSAQSYFVKPYPRIIAIHLTILIGGGLAMATNYGAAVLGVFVLIKTAIDLGGHISSHLSAQRANS